MENVIESYMIALGFDPNMTELSKFKGALGDAGKVVTLTSGGAVKQLLEWQAGITGVFTAVGVGVLGMVDHVAMADQSNRLLALQMFTTTDRARELTIATDALGASMEQIAWDPELHQRFVQNIDDQERMSKALGMGSGYEEQIKHFRDIRNEFSRMRVEAEYLSMGFTRELFIQMGDGPDALQHKLEHLNDWIQGKIPGMSKYLAAHLLPVLSDWEKIMVDTGGALEETGLAFTNLVGALSGDDKLQGTVFKFEKMADAIGKVSHWLGVLVDDAILAERTVLHFAEGATFGLEAAMAAVHGNWEQAKKYRELAGFEIKAAEKDITPGSGAILGAVGESIGGSMAAGAAAGMVGGPLAMVLGAVGGAGLGAFNGALDGYAAGRLINGPGEHGLEAGDAGHVGGHQNDAIREYITKAAKRYNMDPALMHSIAYQESGEQQYGKDGNVKMSDKGAAGIFQLEPKAAHDMGVDRMDPQQNVDGGTGYMAMLLDKYKGNEMLALEAYNWGPGNIEKTHGDQDQVPSGVRAYAVSIEQRKQSLSDQYSGDQRNTANPDTTHKPARITINSMQINVPPQNQMTHEHVAAAVKDGLDRATQNNMSELAGVY